MSASSFSIGQRARAAGAKVGTIRHYERIGVMPEPARSSGNYRAHSEERVRRLAFVRRCRGRDAGVILLGPRGETQEPRSREAGGGRSTAQQKAGDPYGTRTRVFNVRG